MDDLVALITQILNGDADALQRYADAGPDLVDASLSGEPGTVDPAAVVAQALANTDLDPETQTAVLDAVNAATTPDTNYTNEQLADIFAQGINITVEEGDQINIDNSLYVDGDVKGGIYQENQTNLTQADDGAIIANDTHDSNFQTGTDNVQLTDVHADNITTGNNNTVASDHSTIGNENINADYIQDAEFGDGNKDASTDANIDIAHSGNYTSDHNAYLSDDDTTTTNLDLDAYGKAAPYPEDKADYNDPYEPKADYDGKADPVYDDPYKPEPVYDGKADPVYDEPEPEVHYGE